MTEDGDEDAIWIARIDGDHGDLLTVAEPKMRPRLSGVARFVDAVTGGEIGTLQSLAAAYVDDVRIGGSHRDRANGAGGLIVEDGRPDAAVVGGLPDAAVVDADVKDIGLIAHADGGNGAPAAEGPDHAPAHLLHHPRIDLSGERGSEE